MKTDGPDNPHPAPERPAAHRQRDREDQRSIEELSAPFESQQKPISSPRGFELDLVLEGILFQISQVVPYDSACIFLISDGSLLAVAARDLPDPSQVIGRLFPLDHGLAQEVLLGRQPVVLDDARENPSFSGWGDTGDTRGWMGVPLVAHEASLGYLTLNCRRPGAYGPLEARMAQAFANQAAMTIENARLYDEAQTWLEQTRQQADQRQLLMDIIPDGIVLIDQEQRIVQANDAAQAYLAHLANAQVGQLLTQLANEPLGKLLEPGATGSNWHELTAVEPRGVFEVSAQPLGERDRQGGWLLLIRNVTAARKQEGYLRSQERLSSVGQLAAGIAHDFNNIMAVISLYTQLVMRTNTLGEMDQQRLSVIQRQAQRASDLIRQILDFSRQTVVERKPMDLLPFVKDAVRSMRQSLPQQIQLETRLDDDEYLTRGDSGRLLQALNNLALNAVDAMPDGGALRFSLQNLHLQPGEPLPLPDMKADNWICLTVSDTGPGIPPEVLPRLFEPFYSTKATGQGTGLGLAQVYGIVKLHNGFIDVDSQIGGGTTFTIYLPAFTPPAQEAAIAGDDVTYSGAGETILIVEDDHATREALAEYMSFLKYHVLTSSNGREALQLYQESGGNVQLVLTDMVMPVMDGATLFAELKRLGADVKMVVITGYPLESNLVDLLEQEAVSFIQKPLRVEEVARTIHGALNPTHD